MSNRSSTKALINNTGHDVPRIPTRYGDTELQILILEFDRYGDWSAGGYCSVYHEQMVTGAKAVFGAKIAIFRCMERKKAIDALRWGTSIACFVNVVRGSTFWDLCYHPT